MSNIVSVEEAASILNVSHVHVYRMIKQGKLKAVKTDSGLRVVLEDELREDVRIYGVSKSTVCRWLKDIGSKYPVFLRDNTPVLLYVLAEFKFRAYIHRCLNYPGAKLTAQNIAESFVYEYNFLIPKFLPRVESKSVRSVLGKIRRALRSMVRRGVIKRVGRYYMLVSNVQDNVDGIGCGSCRVYRFTLGKEFKFSPPKADVSQIVSDLKEIRARLFSYIRQYENLLAQAGGSVMG
ncbi:MAG: helix-turn-helix domain-containing protein [Thermoproteota archaeon]